MSLQKADKEQVKTEEGLPSYFLVIIELLEQIVENTKK